MPRSRMCVFCGKEFPPGTGIMYVRNDGSVFWFCSSKCRKSSIKLRRDARKFPWTNYYGKEERGRV